MDPVFSRRVWYFDESLLGLVFHIVFSFNTFPNVFVDILMGETDANRCSFKPETPLRCSKQLFLCGSSPKSSSHLFMWQLLMVFPSPSAFKFEFWNNSSKFQTCMLFECVCQDFFFLRSHTEFQKVMMFDFNVCV